MRGNSKYLVHFFTGLEFPSFKVKALVTAAKLIRDVSKSFSILKVFDRRSKSKNQSTEVNN